MSLLTSSRCRSRPLIPGSRTSSTRQLRASRDALAKNSCAEENACTFSPAERSRLLRLSRIDDSSSITQTSGLFSFMGLPLKNQRPEVSEILLDLGPTAIGPWSWTLVQPRYDVRLKIPNFSAARTRSA